MSSSSSCSSTMSITAQLLGSHRLSVAPSLHIFYEGSRLLINAGENVQRYHLEKKLHIHRISDVFLTSLSPAAAAGLIGLLLSLEGTGSAAVTLWGPHGLRPLLQLAMRTFAGLNHLEINYRLMGPPEAPPSLLGERYCTDGVCRGGCRRRGSAGSSSSSSSSSKGPRTCACSYGPSVKGTASGIPVEAFYLPHSGRQQQQQLEDNPLLSSSSSSTSTTSSNSSGNYNYGDTSEPTTATAAAAAASSPTAAEENGSLKRRKLEEELQGKFDQKCPAAAATAAAAAATSRSSSSSVEAAKAALFGDYGDSSDCLLLLLQCPT
ncbi:ELAC2, putative, partial [Eimeria tenella]